MKTEKFISDLDAVQCAINELSINEKTYRLLQSVLQGFKDRAADITTSWNNSDEKWNIKDYAKKWHWFYDSKRNHGTNWP